MLQKALLPQHSPIHRRFTSMAAQTQPPQERPLPGPTPALPPPQEAAVQGASLPPPRANCYSSVSANATGQVADREGAHSTPSSRFQPAQTPGSSPASTNLAHPHTASCARLLQTADIPPRDSSPCEVPQPLAI